jgi:hypothetical protein
MTCAKLSKFCTSGEFADLVEFVVAEFFEESRIARVSFNTSPSTFDIEVRIFSIFAILTNL